MARRGYVLTWDAIIALVFVLLILAGFLSIPYFRSIGEAEVGPRRVHEVSEDSLEYLSKSNIISEIGDKWARGNMTGAAGDVKSNLEDIIPPHMGYRVEFEDTVVYSSDLDPLSQRPKEPAALDETRAVRFVSGFKENESLKGWVARAMLLFNYTGHIDFLWWDSREAKVVNMTFPPGGIQKRVPYLKIPLAANVINSTMNISWQPPCEEPSASPAPSGSPSPGASPSPSPGP